MEDRLSALPDEVIFHLLSFLPPKIIVQTSILAKWWRFRWIHLPCFVATTDITDEVMSQNFSNTLFNIGPDTGNHEFKSWVASVLARNPRNLVLELNQRLTLPQSLFTCETLQYMRILDGGDIPDVGPVYFPSLKKLELVNVGYESPQSLPHLLSGCPLLEELRVEKINKKLCVVRLKTLTTLVIHTENSDYVHFVVHSLRYLRLNVRVSEIDYIHVCFAPLSLIEADIDIMNVATYRRPWSVIDFVRELYNVRRLTLLTCPLNVSTCYFFKLDGVRFHNLTELSLRTDWRFIMYFLKNADNLQVLTIRSMVGPVDPSNHWMEPKPVHVCLVSHLKTVNLIDFRWHKRHEFDMVKYILKNAKVLKRMKITYAQNYPLNSKLEAIKKFEMLEIESRKCKLMCY